MIRVYSTTENFSHSGSKKADVIIGLRPLTHIIIDKHWCGTTRSPVEAPLCTGNLSGS